MRYLINNIIWRVIIATVVNIVFLALGILFCATIVFIPLGIRCFRVLKYPIWGVYYKANCDFNDREDDNKFYGTIWFILTLPIAIVLSGLDIVLRLTFIFAPIGKAFGSLRTTMVNPKNSYVVLDLKGLLTQIARCKTLAEKHPRYQNRIDRLENKLVKEIFKDRVDYTAYDPGLAQSVLSPEVFNTLKEGLELHIEANKSAMFS